MTSKILITGGLGYIGSHTCVALVAAGYEIVILDNSSTSKPRALDQLAKVLNFSPEFVLGDIRDRALLDKVFSDNSIAAVMHFAGLKDAAESVREPLPYFETNVQGTVNLLQAMKHVAVNCLIFSSSAAVYGEPRQVPIREGSERLPANPYGRSKLFVEDILEDVFHSNRVLVGLGESGPIRDRPRIERHNVGEHPLLQHPATVEAQVLGGECAEPANRFLKRHQFLVANVASKQS